MNIPEIREAVDFLTKWPKNEVREAETYLKHINVLLSLADSVLAAEMPEKEIEDVYMPQTTEEKCVFNWGYANGFNKALDAMRLVVARDYVRKDSLPSVEQILKIIDKHTSIRWERGSCGQVAVIAFDKKMECAKDLARAVAGMWGKS